MTGPHQALEVVGRFATSCMNRSVHIGFVVCFLTGSVFAASPEAPPPIPACDIVTTVSRFTIPRIKLTAPCSLEEALHTIYRGYRDIDVDPPRERMFAFEYRLSEATLRRQISFEARDITMIQAIKLVLSDLPVALTFEPGKVIFSEPSSPTDASTPKSKP